MYHDNYKALPWVGGPEGTGTSDHWGIHPKPDQLSYLSGFPILLFDAYISAYEYEIRLNSL